MGRLRAILTHEAAHGPYHAGAATLNDEKDTIRRMAKLRDQAVNDAESKRGRDARTLLGEVHRALKSRSAPRCSWGGRVCRSLGS